MAEPTVDCRGLACPQPVINTKKALDAMAGGVIKVLVDNETSRENLLMFAKNAGCRTIVRDSGGFYEVRIIKGNSVPEETVPKAETAATVTSACLFLSNILGQGPPDLGMVLMKSFFVSLRETEPLPEALLFMNTGVLLACTGSPVLDHLKWLEGKGVAVISCGTCLDYLKSSDRLQAGRVGNMFEINGIMNSTAKVITIT